MMTEKVEIKYHKKMIGGQYYSLSLKHASIQVITL